MPVLEESPLRTTAVQGVFTTLLQGRSPLADPGFGSSSRIDILLGVADVARARRDAQVRSADHSIQLDLTIFCSGQYPATQSEEIVMRVSEWTSDQMPPTTTLTRVSGCMRLSLAVIT